MNAMLPKAPAHVLFVAQVDRVAGVAKQRIHAFSGSLDYAAVADELEALGHAARQLATQALVLETASGFRRI